MININVYPFYILCNYHSLYYSGWYCNIPASDAFHPPHTSTQSGTAWGDGYRILTWCGHGIAVHPLVSCILYGGVTGMNTPDKDTHEAAPTPELPSTSCRPPTYAELKYLWIHGTTLVWSTLHLKWTGQYNLSTAYRNLSARGYITGRWQTVTSLQTRAHSSRQYRMAQQWDVATAPTSPIFPRTSAWQHGKSKTL